MVTSRWSSTVETTPPYTFEVINDYPTWQHAHVTFTADTAADALYRASVWLRHNATIAVSWVNPQQLDSGWQVVVGIRQDFDGDEDADDTDR